MANDKSTETSASPSRAPPPIITISASVDDENDPTESKRRLSNVSNHHHHHHHRRFKHHFKRRGKRRKNYKSSYSSSSSSSKSSFGKFVGIMFLLLIVGITFVAIRGGGSNHTQMMCAVFVFIFFSVALFSYGYWNAVNRGDGIWQYVGPTSLQHQQMSNPNYHFDQTTRDSIPLEHQHEQRITPYLVMPPKMGGAKLEIYTPKLLEVAVNHNHHHRRRSSSRPSSPSNHTHAHGHHHHRHHHGSTNNINNNNQTTSEPIKVINEFGDTNEPIHCEVMLPPSRNDVDKDFVEIFLPQQQQSK